MAAAAARAEASISAGGAGGASATGAGGTTSGGGTAASTAAVPVAHEHWQKFSNLSTDIYREDDRYVKRMDINDFRNRFLVSRAAEEIRKDTGVELEVRGKYYPGEFIGVCVVGWGGWRRRL